MKKIFICLFFLIGGFICTYANINGNTDIPNSYQGNRYYIKFMHTGSHGLCFFEGGGCRHWTPSNAYDCRTGQYYVEDEVIYITWDNGQRESVRLNYDSRGQAYIYYRGKTYYDGYVER